MAESIIDIKSDIEKLREALKLMIEETGSYKGAKEELVETVIQIVKLTDETKLIVADNIELVKRLEKIEDSIKKQFDELSGKVNSDLESSFKKNSAQIHELSDVISKFEANQKEFNTCFEKKQKEIIDRMEKRQNATLERMDTEQKAFNNKLFLTCIGGFSLISVLIIFGYFL